RLSACLLPPPSPLFPYTTLFRSRLGPQSPAYGRRHLSLAMPTSYVTCGLKAEDLGEIAFGLFMTLVGTPLIAYAETLEDPDTTAGRSFPSSELSHTISGGV